jgi:6-pyruvoyltetrahydropterin/6-carboxytetrahydropterin synthase
MYSIRVSAEFSAAHNLRGYKGKCEELHGHNWKVEIMARSRKLDKLGMVLDFTIVKSELKKVLEELDHKYLNSLPAFKKANPTSENIAGYLYRRIKTRIPILATITVWESGGASATFGK